MSHASQQDAMACRSSTAVWPYLHVPIRILMLADSAPMKQHVSYSLIAGSGPRKGLIPRPQSEYIRPCGRLIPPLRKPTVAKWIQLSEHGVWYSSWGVRPIALLLETASSWANGSSRNISIIHIIYSCVLLLIYIPILYISYCTRRIIISSIYI